MKYIGLLAADKLGQLSTSFCIQKMREAGISDIFIYTKYYSSGTSRFVTRIGSLDSLLAILSKYDDEDMVICSRDNRSYKAMKKNNYIKDGVFVPYSSHHAPSGAYPAKWFEGAKTLLNENFAVNVGTLKSAIYQAGINSVGTVAVSSPYKGKSIKAAGASGGKTIVGLASYLAREKGMLTVAKTIAPQCDELHISLNGYDRDGVERVRRRLEGMANVIVTGYCGNDDLGCQNKFRAVDMCGEDDYFLTVDDDFLYPYDYVSTMVKYCDRYSGKAFMTCEGAIYPKNNIGGFNISKALEYVSTLKSNYEFKELTIPGNATSCCIPSVIGLSFKEFVAPKNTGDDEIVANFCRVGGVKIVAVPHREGWIRSNHDVKKITPLSSSMSAIRDRRASLALPPDKLVEGRTGCMFHIITPFYNDSALLGRCLESVSKQTLDKKEIMMTVVDDASDEEEFNAAKMLCEKYRFVTLLRNKTRTMAGGARNMALGLGVKSEYTVFLDSDDMLYDERSLERLKRTIEGSGRPDVVLCGFVFNSTGKERMFSATTPEQMSTLQAIAPWTRVTRTEKVCRFVPDRRMGNDIVQFLRQVDCIDTVASTDFKFIRYMNDNSLSCWNNPGARKNWEAACALCMAAPDIMHEKFVHEYTKTRARQLVVQESRDAYNLITKMGERDFPW